MGTEGIMWVTANLLVKGELYVNALNSTYVWCSFMQNYLLACLILVSLANCTITCMIENLAFLCTSVVLPIGSQFFSWWSFNFAVFCFIIVVMMDSVILNIDNMTCMSCVTNIEEKLSAKDGVKKVEVKLDDKMG